MLEGRQNHRRNKRQTRSFHGVEEQFDSNRGNSGRDSASLAAIFRLFRLVSAWDDI